MTWQTLRGVVAEYRWTIGYVTAWGSMVVALCIIGGGR